MRRSSAFFLGYVLGACVGCTHESGQTGSASCQGPCQCEVLAFGSVSVLGDVVATAPGEATIRVAQVLTPTRPIDQTLFPQVVVREGDVIRGATLGGPSCMAEPVSPFAPGDRVFAAIESSRYAVPPERDGAICAPAASCSDAGRAGPEGGAPPPADSDAGPRFIELQAPLELASPSDPLVFANGDDVAFADIPALSDATTCIARFAGPCNDTPSPKTNGGCALRSGARSDARAFSALAVIALLAAARRRRSVR